MAVFPMVKGVPSGGGISGTKIQVTLATVGSTSSGAITFPANLFKTAKYVSGSAVYSMQYSVDSGASSTMTVGNTYQVDSATTSVSFTVSRQSSQGTASAVLELEFV